ncbi:hypothetical protein [Flavobacterium sp. CS20]|nr:hypothetical protein [Flavobacterium sp. CS20]QTY27288.1 hypothetical protein IGB25_01510 [Flavobacterium sp. CS20]
MYKLNVQEDILSKDVPSFLGSTLAYVQLNGASSQVANVIYPVTPPIL